jgi:hypothetical protein
MGNAEWNLDLLSIPFFRIHQISLHSSVPGDSNLAGDRRLLVFANFLAFRGFPAFFLAQPPPYTESDASGSVVLVFDIFGRFINFPISPCFAVISKDFAVESPFIGPLYDHLQRALILVSYYELRHLKPLYFTSYLLFPGSPTQSDPFLFQKIPIKRDRSLCIRTSVKGSLDFVIDCRWSVPVGSFILVPPHEHPYSVIGSTADVLFLLSIEQEMSTINFRETPFVLFTRPTSLLPKFYQTQTSRPNPKSQFCHFAPTDFYSDPPDAVDSFLSHRFATPPLSADAPSPLPERFLEFPDFSIEEILSQLVPDAAERAAIRPNVSAFPSSRCPTLRTVVATFLSLVRFDFGFSVVRPPFHAHPMIASSTCRYERLGIPRILVNCCGSAVEAAANAVVAEWETKRYAPVSGPKSAHFSVVCSAGVRMAAVKCFFSELRHIYCLLQFGNLSPFPRFEAYYEVANEGIPAFIREFFTDQILGEFQQFPILTFIVGPMIFDADFSPHSIISYVRPESVATASADEIKTFAFVVYSRIRVFAPCPFGMINIAQNESATLFFGFRYQPPFVLKRAAGAELTIHIAWDCATEASAWIDDAGSALHHFPRTPIHKLHQLMVDLARLLTGTQVRFTLVLLAEGISRGRLERLLRQMNDLEIEIFTVVPEPAVQVMFNEEFDDDAAISGVAEQFREDLDGEFIDPDASCFVVARSLPAYSASVYGIGNQERAREVLLHFVTAMSHLSWLSVKPGSEMRTISIPPHVVALLRRIEPSCTVLSRYEFLPSIERI